MYDAGSGIDPAFFCAAAAWIRCIVAQIVQDFDGLRARVRACVRALEDAPGWARMSMPPFCHLFSGAGKLPDG